MWWIIFCPGCCFRSDSQSVITEASYHLIKAGDEHWASWGSGASVMWLTDSWCLPTDESLKQHVRLKKHARGSGAPGEAVGIGSSIPWKRLKTSSSGLDWCFEHGFGTQEKTDWDCTWWYQHLLWSAGEVSGLLWSFESQWTADLCIVTVMRTFC